MSTTKSDEQAALLTALRQVLQPLATLAVQRGLPYATVEEMLRRAFVAAADSLHPDMLAHRKVSRLSTSTGINRREVARLLAVLRDAQASQELPQRSLAAEVFAHWMSDARYLDRYGEPKVLRRQGRAPSFETLAQAITRDVHPRSLLDELLRLKMAVHHGDSDTVELARDAFVPRGDRVRMLQYLGSNVGDHLTGAVANVLGDGQRHFEQAIYADGLSEASVQEAWRHVGELWKSLMGALVPALESSVERDRNAAGNTRRLRLGLYTYDEDTAPVEPKAPVRKARKR
jgi:Family of unknown function (DUF6502)